MPRGKKKSPRSEAINPPGSAPSADETPATPATAAVGNTRPDAAPCWKSVKTVDTADDALSGELAEDLRESSVVIDDHMSEDGEETSATGTADESDILPSIPMFPPPTATVEEKLPSGEEATSVPVKPYTVFPMQLESEGGDDKSAPSSEADSDPNTAEIDGHDVWVDRSLKTPNVRIMFDPKFVVRMQRWAKNLGFRTFRDFIVSKFEWQALDVRLTDSDKETLARIEEFAKSVKDCPNN